MADKLVILDRDGVLNRDLPQSVTRLEDFEILDTAPAAVAALTRAGYRVAIATNQACVGRGELAPATLREIHRRLREAVVAAGGRIDAIYVCPEAAADANDRRKPGPGMLREALSDFGAEASEVWFVGDSRGDLEAAAAIGCRPALVRTGKGDDVLARGIPDKLGPVAVFDNLSGFAQNVAGGRD
jgi:D-glycero-D-manno-heptose 1,7-bisphosphate phosphatase